MRFWLTISEHVSTPGSVATPGVVLVGRFVVVSLGVALIASRSLLKHALLARSSGIIVLFRKAKAAVSHVGIIGVVAAVED